MMRIADEEGDSAQNGSSGLLDMASPAEQIASAGGVDSIQPEQGIAGRGAALEFMHVVAGSAFHFVVEQQGLINRLAHQARTAPIERYRGGADGQVILRVPIR